VAARRCHAAPVAGGDAVPWQTCMLRQGARRGFLVLAPGTAEVGMAIAGVTLASRRAKTTAASALRIARRLSAGEAGSRPSPRMLGVDPALGVPLRGMEEIAWPSDHEAQAAAADSFKQRFVLPRAPAEDGAEPKHSWEDARPCVVRGFARDWDFVRTGRLDPAVERLWRESLRDEQCPTEFQPGPSHLKYEVVEGMDPQLRLVNPALLLLGFPDFVDACHLKNLAGPTSDDRVADAAASPQRRAIAANVAYEGPGWEQDPRLLPLRPRPVDVDFGAAAEHFSLYCAQHDIAHWPASVLESIAPHDPAEQLMPSWVDSSRSPTVNTWMCGGGPKNGPVSCNFHCDYSENMHVVLSGKKEFFMCHPSDIGVLGGTSYCAQAVWSIAEARTCLPPSVHLEQIMRSDLRTPMCVTSIDAAFEENSALVPALHHATARRLRPTGAEDPSRGSGPTLGVRVDDDGSVVIEGDSDASTSKWHDSGPLWAELEAGDLVYIPPGWFHGVRTWRPSAEERGLPFALSVNFWHQCRDELWEKEKLFRFLDVCSIRQALVGDRDALLGDWMSKLQDAA